MQKPKVLVVSPLHPAAKAKLEEAQRAGIFEVVTEIHPPEDKLIQLAKDADAIIVRYKPVIISKKVIDAAKNLKLIQIAAVGMDHVDVEAAKAKGIIVNNIPGENAQSVAEHAIGLMLAVARKTVFNDKKVRSGVWLFGKPESQGIELNGKVLGIVGAGTIGTKVAYIASRGFNMKILYYDVVRNAKIEQELGAEYVPLDELFSRADIVTLHVPGIPETKHLVNEQRLRLMKKTAILINTSRGMVVDTQALVKALKEGWIYGAGLDVLEDEPPSLDNPLYKELFQLDNVVVTSHIGASTEEALMRTHVKAVEYVINFFKSKQ